MWSWRCWGLLLYCHADSVVHRKVSSCCCQQNTLREVLEAWEAATMHLMLYMRSLLLAVQIPLLEVPEAWEAPSMHSSLCFLHEIPSFFTACRSRCLRCPRPGRLPWFGRLRPGPSCPPLLCPPPPSTPLSTPTSRSTAWPSQMMQRAWQVRRRLPCHSLSLLPRCWGSPLLLPILSLFAFYVSNALFFLSLSLLFILTTPQFLLTTCPCSF